MLCKRHFVDANIQAVLNSFTYLFKECVEGLSSFFTVIVFVLWERNAKCHRLQSGLYYLLYAYFFRRILYSMPQSSHNPTWDTFIFLNYGTSVRKGMWTQDATITCFTKTWITHFLSLQVSWLTSAHKKLHMTGSVTVLDVDRKYIEIMYTNPYCTFAIFCDWDINRNSWIDPNLNSRIKLIQTSNLSCAKSNHFIWRLTNIWTWTKGSKRIQWKCQ